MSNLQIFNNSEFGRIRIVNCDGEWWFVAKDVCDILEHSNSRMALERLEYDEKGVSSIDTPGGIQAMQTVNEPGLYSLILGSRKPEAKAFKRWITHEVLPSIRKTGQYSLNNLEISLKEKGLIAQEAQANCSLYQVEINRAKNESMGLRMTIMELREKNIELTKKLAQSKADLSIEEWNTNRLRDELDKIKKLYNHTDDIGATKWLR